MSDHRPPLSPIAFAEVCAYAVANAILPEDVIRVAAGLRSREPFLIDVNRLDQRFSLGRRFLTILAELSRGDNVLFGNSVPKVRGTVRTYFGRSPEEVESTGSSNNAKPITGTVWFVSVNNSDDKRKQIVASVMQHMGFSPAYVTMISKLCIHHKPSLPSIYAGALARMTRKTDEPG